MYAQRTAAGFSTVALDVPDMEAYLQPKGISDSCFNVMADEPAVRGESPRFPNMPASEAQHRPVRHPSEASC